MVRDERFLALVRLGLESLYDMHGDRKEVKIFTVPKNNGIKLTGVGFQKEKMTPVVYLEQFYEEYGAGRDVTEILYEIYAALKKYHTTPALDMEKIKDFAYVQNKITYKIVNQEYNQKLLETIPHKKMHDIAVIFSLVWEPEEQGMYAAIIRNEYMEMWGVNTEKLYQAALQNTPRIFPVLFETFNDAVMKLAEEMQEEDVKEETQKMAVSEKIPWYVLTNKQKINGASVILYPGVLREVTKKLESDLLIIPSSIHEVLILPDDGKMDIAKLKGIVFSINRTSLEVKDRLADSVYRYRRAAGNEHFEVI